MSGRRIPRLADAQATDRYDIAGLCGDEAADEDDATFEPEPADSVLGPWCDSKRPFDDEDEDDYDELDDELDEDFDDFDEELDDDLDEDEDDEDDFDDDFDLFEPDESI